MVRLALLAAALALGCAPSHAADRPPPIPIHETPVMAFSDARFEFHLADLAGPVSVHIRMAPPGDKFRIGGVDVTYGSQSVAIGEDLLADIPEPNLFRLWATAIVMPHQTVIALFLSDSRGRVEFDWTLGEGVRKIDYRQRK